MRFRRMPYLTLFLGAMFFANNAAAAICALLADAAGPGHVAVHALDASAGEPACPQSDEAGRCLKHYVQSYQNGEHKMWVDAPAERFVPVADVLLVSMPAQPKLALAAPTAAIVGPPLTILYRNLRN